MKTVLIAFFTSFISMLIIDGVWLTTMTKRFYSPLLSHLMAKTPQLLPAIIFYFIYIAGLVIFIILPAMQNKTALLTVFFLGAFLGLIAYGTYDLTNQATLKDWPVIVTIVDLIWGSLLTGVVSVISVYLTRLFS